MKEGEDDIESIYKVDGGTKENTYDEGDCLSQGEEGGGGRTPPCPT